MEHRLIAFGCSFTFGHGLEDCWDENYQSCGKYPSNLAWPSVLAQILKKECVNMSLPGSSNKLILSRITNFEFQKKDIAVILWSKTPRVSIFTNKDHYVNLSTAYIQDRKDKHDYFWQTIENYTGYNKEEYINLNKTYYTDYYEEYDALHDQFVRMNFVHNYLKKYKIKSYHLMMDTEIKEKNMKKFNHLMMDDINFKIFDWKKDYKIDTALDDKFGWKAAHPGPKSQWLFASNINKWFFKK